MSQTPLEEAVQKIVDAVSELIYVDPHDWSSRPCATCRTIMALTGKPFGCYEYQRRKLVGESRRAPEGTKP